MSIKVNTHNITGRPSRSQWYNIWHLYIIWLLSTFQALYTELQIGIVSFNLNWNRPYLTWRRAKETLSKTPIPYLFDSREPECGNLSLLGMAVN